MNNIELILENSLFDMNQFNATQIAVLNEMITNGISKDQVSIIAHPSVSDLSYSVIYEYLSKGNSITSKEYQKYLNIDTNRINEIIVNVYLGKLHGLSEEQISLYTQKSVFNIKIARLLIENSKDASPEQLNQLVTGKFGTKSIVGKQAIRDYLNNELTLVQLLSLTECSELTQDNYDFIKQADSRTLNIIKDGYNKQFFNNDLLAESKVLKQSLHITTNTNICVNTSYRYDNTYIQFDTINTYNKFQKIFKRIKENGDNYPVECFDIDISKIYEYYKCNFTINNNFIKLSDYIDTNIAQYIDNKLCWDNFSWILRFYLDSKYNRYICYDRRTCERTFNQEFQTLDEYFEVFMNTNGFKDYIQAKWIDKLSENDINNIKQGKSVLQSLLELYKTKKDKETEIPYLEEHLKNISDKQIIEVRYMKENKCSNDEIHLYIEKYLSATNYLPSMYFNEDNNYSKYWNISEFLNLNNLNIKVSDLYKLKEANCSDEDIQFIEDNGLKLNDSPVQKQLIDIYKDYGISNIKFLTKDKYLYVTANDDYTTDIVENYTYAKSVFKDKVKCIGYYLIYHCSYRIPEHLVQYIDNFDDDTLYKAYLYSDSYAYIGFLLKMSVITTDYKILLDMCTSANSYDKIVDFTKTDEKVTKDVVISFCKDVNIKVPKEIKDIINSESVDVIIEKSVDYFGNSKNFKPIKYDEETTYIDIIGNKALKGTHMITFNKEDNNYEYIFEIAHKEDTLTYSANITTKKDVKDAITKSIALIENIEEYQVYVEELQNLYNTI